MNPEQRQRRNASQRRYYARMHPDMGFKSKKGHIHDIVYNGCKKYLDTLNPLKLSISGWLKGDIEKERMEEIKRQIEMG